MHLCSTADALIFNGRCTYVQRLMHLCSSEGGIFLKNAVCLCGEVSINFAHILISSGLPYFAKIKSLFKFSNKVIAKLT